MTVEANAGTVSYNECNGGRVCTDVRNCLCQSKSPAPTPKPTNPKPTPSPTITFAPTAYLQLSASTCSDSGLLAMTESECEAAAAYAGLRFDKVKCRKAHKYPPRGCFVVTEGPNRGTVSYQKCNGGGRCTSHRQCMCNTYSAPDPKPTISGGGGGGGRNTEAGMIAGIAIGSIFGLCMVIGCLVNISSLWNARGERRSGCNRTTPEPIATVSASWRRSARPVDAAAELVPIPTAVIVPPTDRGASSADAMIQELSSIELTEASRMSPRVRGTPRKPRSPLWRVESI